MDGQYPPSGGGPPPPPPPLGPFYPAAYPPPSGDHPSLPPSSLLRPDIFPPGLISPVAVDPLLVGFPPQAPLSHQLPLEYGDPNHLIMTPTASTAGPPPRRRRPAMGAEHVKHRRTRSGCYTCRQRRVKCDEVHPICDRCRKGKRECNYPGSNASATSSAAPGRAAGDSRESETSPGASSGGSMSEDDDDDGDDNDTNAPLFAIPDDEDLSGDLEDDDPQSATSDGRKRSTSSSAAAFDQPTSPSNASSASWTRAPTRPGAPGRTSSKTSVRSNVSQGGSINNSSRWASLAPDVKLHLRYFREQITPHHYAFKPDAGADSFLHTTLLEMALADSSSALLYGIVAFAAYHHSLTQPNARIAVFLSYYNKSIMFLQQSLTSKRHSMDTLLTILQLAAIEEYLGDWVNLLGHQRAAHQILTQLLTPQTAVQDETRRRALAWYYRFDLFAGLLAGGNPTLGREWAAVVNEYHHNEALRRPDDLATQFEACFARSRLLASDITRLFASASQHRVGGSDNADERNFASSLQQLEAEVAAVGDSFTSTFADHANFIKPFNPSSADAAAIPDLTDFRSDPEFFYAGECDPINFILIDFWGIALTFHFQARRAQEALASGIGGGAGLAADQDPICAGLAIRICKMFEAIEAQHGAAGVLGAQASLGIAALCLPRDQKHGEWLCRKLARVEGLGYIYPNTFRARMSELLGRDVNEWWLPDGEGLPRIIQHMREFVRYRGTNATDEWSVGVRDMNGLFQDLQIDGAGGAGDGNVGGPGG